EQANKFLGGSPLSKELDDNKTFIDYQIQNECTVSIVVQIKGDSTAVPTGVCSVNVELQSANEQLMVFNIRSSDLTTINEIKEKLFSEHQIPLKQQRLIFDGRLLTGERTLVQCKIKENNVILLII
ncbi:unnamed protein product, partial [Didymodactylos carnosus]